MSGIKSTVDGFVGLTSTPGALSAFATTMLGISSFFKDLPKYLQELPARFQEVVPSFIKDGLPAICEKKIEPFFSPIKDFLSIVNFFSTIKTVSDSDFTKKSGATKASTIFALISSGIDTLVLIPNKLQWFSVAGFLSNTFGSYSPFLQTAFSVDSFTIIGRIAGIFSACFNIKNSVDEIGSSNKKIASCNAKIINLGEALDKKDPKTGAIIETTEKKVNEIATAYCLGRSQDSTNPLADAQKKASNLTEEIQKLESILAAPRTNSESSDRERIEQTKQNLAQIKLELEQTQEEIRRLNGFTDSLAGAYKKVFSLPVEIKDLENSLVELRTSNDSETNEKIEKITKEKELKEKELEETHEEIRRLHYFQGELGDKKLVVNAKARFLCGFIQSSLKAFLEQQSEISNLIDHDELLKRKFPKVKDLNKKKNSLRKKLLPVEVREQLKAFSTEDFKMHESDYMDRFDQLLTRNNIREGTVIINPPNMANINKIAPVVTNSSLKNKIVKEIINYEIDQSKIDIATQKSQKTKFGILTAFDISRIALTALLLIKPIAIVAGITLAVPFVGAVSAALFGVGLVLTIVGLTRSIVNLYWLDPKTQAKPQTRIMNLIQSEP